MIPGRSLLPKPIGRSVAPAQRIARLEYIRQTGAIAGDTEQLLWWNFTKTEQEHFFSPWYKRESLWLENNDVSSFEDIRRTYIHDYLAELKDFGLETATLARRLVAIKMLVFQFLISC